ncbi:unnamed protein product [Prunus armeniaca]
MCALESKESVSFFFVFTQPNPSKQTWLEETHEKQDCRDGSICDGPKPLVPRSCDLNGAPPSHDATIVNLPHTHVVGPPHGSMVGAVRSHKA